MPAQPTLRIYRIEHDNSAAYGVNLIANEIWLLVSARSSYSDNRLSL